VSQVQISAIIPSHNEERTIGNVARVTHHFTDELIVVDDSSSDGTYNEAKGAGAIVVRNERNLGYIGSIKRGFLAAHGDVFVTLDADGEHDPADIPALINPIINDEADLVFGMRKVVPRPSERLINRLVRRRANGIPDTGTGFKALRRDLALQLELNGRCTCGIFALEAIALGARLQGVSTTPRATSKPRRVAWEHLPQTFIVIKRLLLG
jgi:glycosyltransferase involved in cell wall biosynthesis